ncbi:hypothetical protein Ahy_B10g104704 isoform B [Arachis hypogaea]|uniref:Aminotransferase-like plant mobile domain-containing protein n=1 Tax=Arachis hypogaea TaxID=3818 RepID=A0A444X6K7_ARAHY|nr:hypothetical protein Ahy_B10g104704 isoform B [Arachis hypogaea]
MPMHERIIPYLERSGLYHLVRLNSHWFWLDEPLVSAFVERWRPETHMFHMPFGEPTWEWFQDLFGKLPPPNKVKQMIVHFTWFHERFRVLADATEDTVCIYARAYIMMLLSTQLFGTRVRTGYIYGGCHLSRILMRWGGIAGGRPLWRSCIDACVGLRIEM